MSYFDGLASGIIKKDRANNSVYYPWGVLGKGYVLPSEARETEIKNMVILFYKIFFAMFFIHLFLLKNALIFAVFVITLLSWFLFQSKKLTKDCPKSDEKLTLKEGYTNSAKAHNKTVLWLLFVMAIIATLAGIASLFSAKLLIAGLFITIVFGASSAAIYYMIQVKNKQEKESD
jgi:hypothetical protein